MHSIVLARRGLRAHTLSHSRKTHSIEISFLAICPQGTFFDVQYTDRRCTVSLLSSRNRGSSFASPSTCPATYSPTAGPCLNPCPDPPPTNHTLLNSGCRSIKKSPFELFSYWHTPVSVIGPPSSPGNRPPPYP